MTDTATHTAHSQNGRDHADLRDRAKDLASSTSEAVEDTATALREKGDAALRDSQDALSSAHQSALMTVRRNPTTALLGAVGVGVLLGLALRARS